ncbi:MAG TPA: lysophospholipid acyltransferase family protein [Solirubrobacterales bacterium]|nr:lysophospholipid acyltransferase family protein [Solirubrobacterales bacterium]
MRPQVYRDPRPAEYFTRFHERAREREPDWIYSLARVVLTLPTILVFRTRAIGLENVPKEAPVILAPNHFSAWDHFFAGVYLRRPLRFMAKSQLFKHPVIEFIFFHGGVFPVRRGARDEEAFITARTILGQGGMVLIYIEGGRSRSRELGQAKPGVGRLALETGVPVIPVAIHGSAGVRGWKRLRFPKVTVQFGKPMWFPVEEGASRERHQEVSDEVFARVREMYGTIEREGRRAARRAAHS